MGPILGMKRARYQASFLSARSPKREVIPARKGTISLSAPTSFGTALAGRRFGP